jgi:hypothetical protein
MRHFTLVGTSTSLLLLALTGCGNPPPHLVDAHVPGDTGPVGVDTNPSDTGIPPTDTGHVGGACTYGTGGCNLTDTSSCPNDASGARQGCYPDDGAPMCHPAGTVQAGAACTSGNDCDAGNVCLGTNVCARLCCSAADCNTGESCNPLNDSTGTALPNHAGVCIRPTTCTPLPASGCMGTENCYVTGSDGSTNCVPGGAVAEAGTCDATNHCGTGLGCYAVGTPPVYTCYRYCRLSMMNADCTGTGRPTCHPAGLGTMFGICDT